MLKIWKVACSINHIIYCPFNFQAWHKSQYCPGPIVTGPRKKRSQYWPWICGPGNTGMASHLGRRLMQMRNQYWPRAIFQYCPRSILILEKLNIMLWRKTLCGRFAGSEFIVDSMVHGLLQKTFCRNLLPLYTSPPLQKSRHGDSRRWPSTIG